MLSTFLFLFYFYNSKFLACSYGLGTPMINALNSMISESFGFIFFLIPCVVYCIAITSFKQFPYLLRSSDVGDFKKCGEAFNSIHL